LNQSINQSKRKERILTWDHSRVSHTGINGQVAMNGNDLVAVYPSDSRDAVAWKAIPFGNDRVNMVIPIAGNFTAKLLRGDDRMELAKRSATQL
jgi:hypothetical protein